MNAPTSTTLRSLALAAALAAVPLSGGAAAASGDILAIRVGRAETVSQGTIQHAVVLVEDGKITAIGQDLPIDRGIPILDRPGWTVMPGLVHPYSRLGLDGRGSNGFNPEVVPTAELYSMDPVYADALERGVTTLGLYPAGTGVSGQAIVVRPAGDERDEMVVSESAYLMVQFNADSRSKKMIRDGFKKVDEHDEKTEKAREKWEKEVEKAKKKKKDDKKDDKKDEKSSALADDEEKKDEGPGPFVPPEPDAKVVPFQALRAGELRALVAISGAGEYLHWLDAVGEEEFGWDLRVPLTRSIDIYEVAEKIGERKLRVVMEPEISLQPGTMRQRNLPAELARAGARVVLIPRRDSISAIEDWLTGVGTVVAAGLERDMALRAVTLEPAELLGLGETHGSLDVGKAANLIFFDGDPLEPSSRLQAVMLEGEFVMGEVTR